MPQEKIDYKYNKTHSIIEVEIIGRHPATAEELEKHYQVLADLSKKHKTKKFILKYRKMIYDQPTQEIFKGSARLKRYEIDEGTVWAFVLDVNSEAYKNLKPFFIDIDTKIALGNLDVSYKVFENYNDALDWIK